MRRFWRTGWAAALSLLAWAAAARGRDLPAEQLMARVRLSMPDVPLELGASIQVVDATGRIQKTVRAAALRSPGADGRTAC